MATTRMRDWSAVFWGSFLARCVRKRKIKVDASISDADGRGEEEGCSGVAGRLGDSSH